MLVREGDRVTEGQVLARFETTELQAKMNERQSALEAARADARWTARDRSDKETLATRNIVSQSAADQARATAENRASMVAVAEAQLEVARKNLADAEVKAPFDGVVGERIANQGESLPIDGKILALLDTSHVEIAAQMPAADVMRMKVGQTANVTLEGFGDRVFDGQHHPHQPDDAGRLALDPGLCRDHRTATRPCAAACSAPAAVTVQEKGHALAVPASAMRKDDQGDYVLAVENDVLVRKPVGAVRTWSRGELVEVKGLESGMTVVSAPLPGLKAGQRVKIARDPLGDRPMKLTQIAVDNPVFATMMMVALLVMGLFSYRQLGIDQFPNVDFPIVVVTTDYPGASPETVESEISRKIEESVNAIAGLKTLTSRSLEGRSIVIAEFELSVPVRRRHAGRPREGPDGARGLPAGDQGAADPAVQSRRPADRVDRRALRRPLGARPHDPGRPDHHQAPADRARRRPRHHRRRPEAPDQHRARSRPHARRCASA